MINPNLNKARQRWALSNPCKTVEQCGRPGCRADFTVAGKSIATILTVDLFTQPLAWHCQIGLIAPNGETKSIEEWDNGDVSAAAEIARQILAGVGAPGADRIIFDELSLTVARQLNIDEAAFVYNITRDFKRIKPVAIAEAAEYNFANKKTQVGDGAFIPQNRIIYEREN